ncbi:MAG: UDP-N-acetylmuramate dehydrogenase [Lacisediminihabitans sp.]
MVAESVELSTLTSLAVGGPARELLSPLHPRQLIETALEVWASGDDWLLLGGGTNTVVSDDGFDGTVIHVATRGIERLRPEAPRSTGPIRLAAGEPEPETRGTRSVRLRVQSGEPWDELVAHTVERGWAGIEALSGIPGSSGAAPVQNIGAYGQELASSLVAVEFLDYLSGELHRIPAAELGLGYRTSALKQGRQGVVISIELGLSEYSDGATALSQPIGYAQLASALGVRIGDRVPVAEFRATVLALRASKGMLLSPDDPESVSAGSFFTNPVVSEGFARTLPTDAPRWPTTEDPPQPVIMPLENFSPAELVPPPTPDAGNRVKLSAAWLIEHAGVTRGFSLPGSRAAVSSKHTLALVNRGGATAAEIAELARYVQSRVLNEFGIILQPEPVLVGIQL